MAEIKKTKAVIMENELLCDGIYSLWLKEESIAKVAKPGQFLSIYCKEGSRLLPRPISICEINEEKTMLRIVFRIAGAGTNEIAEAKKMDEIEIMGPLGNGFFYENTSNSILIGGGIGIPPMLELAKNLPGKKQIVLGYRSETFLVDEFKLYGEVIIATEDGSVGTKGNVIDAMREHGITDGMIFACGPTPMLRGVKSFASEHNLVAQLSMEERMACGIGACLACVCKSKDKDHHSNVNNKRVCKDGPVFYADEIEL